MNLTDNEIIKAIELCFGEDFTECEECPLKSELDGLFSCIPIKQKLILDLIKRLKAENERLQEERIERIRDLTEVVYDKEIAEAKAEAIKEFAERLKKYNEGLYSEFKAKIINEDIDNFVKELTDDFKE